MVSQLKSKAPRLTIIERDSWIPDIVREKMKGWNPTSRLGEIIRDCLRYLPAEQAAELIDRLRCTVVLESSLSVVVFRKPWSDYLYGNNYVEDYGVVSHKAITNLGAGAIVDAFQGLALVTLSSMIYHGLGTNSAAESTSSTGLTAELSSAYGTAGTRPTGTSTETSALVWKSVATSTLSFAATIEEHGIFDDAATTSTAYVLWDRSLTGTQTLSSGDSLQTTYSLTVAAGG